MRVAAPLFFNRCLVPCQGSNAACSLALKPDGVVASRRHSPSYDSSSRLASGLDGGAIKRHFSPDTTLGSHLQPWCKPHQRSLGKPTVEGWSFREQRSVNVRKWAGKPSLAQTLLNLDVGSHRRATAPGPAGSIGFISSTRGGKQRQLTYLPPGYSTPSRPLDPVEMPPP
jgi:hypothetical protein